MTRIRNNKLDELKAYGDFIKMKISEKTDEQQFYWTKLQTYIAWANLLTVCTELKIDACPMECFEPLQYNKILGLTEKGLNAAVITTVGYRSIQDNTQHKAKVRKSMEMGFVSFKPNQVIIDIENIYHQRVKLMAHDLLYGSEGIYVENSLRAEVTNEIVRYMMGDINIAGVPQVSGFKKIFQRNHRNVKVTITDNYWLILKISKTKFQGKPLMGN